MSHQWLIITIKIINSHYIAITSIVSIEHCGNYHNSKMAFAMFTPSLRYYPFLPECNTNATPPTFKLNQS